jgi:anti-anti-sigma factor
VTDRASEGAGGLGRGDHACLVCETEAERWSAVEEFARAGVKRGERLLYVARAGEEEAARRRLQAVGDAGAGELIVAPASIVMAYADGARFDPAERDAAWREQVRAAVGDGFTGLSVAGDMAWFHEAGLTLDQILDYEHRCSGVIDEMPAAALCVYDRDRFDDRTLARAGHAHPICRGRGIAPAGMFVSRTMQIAAAGPGALRLSGEVDVSNVPSLSSALRSTAGGRAAVLLDLGSLEFIDVAGMRAIQRTAQGLAARGGELTVLAPRPLVARMIAMMGMDGLVRTEQPHR